MLECMISANLNLQINQQKLKYSSVHKHNNGGNTRQSPIQSVIILIKLIKNASRKHKKKPSIAQNHSVNQDTNLFLFT